MAVQVNCRREDLLRYNLYSATISISHVGDYVELLLKPMENGEEPRLPVTNKLGRLILPLPFPYGLMDRLLFNMGTPVHILHDEVGRVHQLVLDACIFLVLMREWAPPELQTQLLMLQGVSQEEENRLLTSDGNLINNMSLVLPPNRPSELIMWNPIGEYQVAYDKRGRVFSVTGSGMDIYFAALWETRF